MATLTIYSQFDYRNVPAGGGFDGFEDQRKITLSADQTLLNMSDGFQTLLFGGQGLNFQVDQPITGTLNTFSVEIAGNVLLNISGLNQNVDSHYFDTGYTLDGHTMHYMTALLANWLSADDRVVGSSVSDRLAGFAGNDTLEGGGGNDVLEGWSGNDSLLGGAGNDVLAGGQGQDVLTGGAGNDRFKFGGLGHLGNSSTTRDVITDFTRGQDKIDLSGIDAKLNVAGDQAFSFVNAFTANASTFQVRYSGGVVYLNTDADTGAEYQIQLTGGVPTSLTASDFVL